MGDPITQLTPELIRDHPALGEFARFIQNHGGGNPTPADIAVNYERPHDGIVTMNYLRGDRAYVAQLDAVSRLLRLSHGRATGRIVRGQAEVNFEPEESHPLNGPDEANQLCTTVRTLGGDQEVNAPCGEARPGRRPDAPTPFQEPGFWGKTSWMESLHVANWTFSESILWRYRTRIPSISWGQRGQIVGSSGAGLLAYSFGAFPLSDALGLHAAHHSHERFAIGTGLGYGTYRGVHALLSRRVTGPGPVGLGAGLFTAALFREALSGTSFDSPTSSVGIAGVGLMLPAVFRSSLGNRIPSWYGPRTQAVGRWGGRIMLGAFVADAGYMGINLLSEGSTGSGLSNRIHAEATRLQGRDLGGLASFGHGVVHFLMPSITERFLVGDSYRSTARANLRAEADRIATGSLSYLSQTLVIGSDSDALDPNFYTEIHWDFLHGSNELRDIRLPDGRELPVGSVAMQLNDPEIHRRVMEGGSLDGQIAYIRRQFRGYDLSREDAREILSRIALHRVRGALSELPLLATASDTPLAGIFDSNGALRAGQEPALLQQLFPNQTVPAEQVLVLRRAALAHRIMELRETGASAMTLAAYTAVGRQVGILDTQGNFTDRDEVALARAEFNHGAASRPRITPPPTRAELLREFMTSGASHG